MKEYDFLVNGYEVHAVYPAHFIKEAHQLIQQWRNLAQRQKQRVVIFLAAPPGAGKSTMALLFEQLSHDQNGPSLQALGMDGFHHYQKYILTHDVNVKGVLRPMKEVKGCPESFDFDRLFCYVQQLKKNAILQWPVYDRRLHDVVDDQLEVYAPIVLLEGNYLLLDEDPWRKLKPFCDDSIFLLADEKQVRTRLIQRKMLGGMMPHEAAAFCEQSDLVNVRRILEHRLSAETLILFKADTYSIQKKNK